MSITPVLGTIISGYYLIQSEEFILGFSTPQWIIVFALTAITMAFAITPTTYIALAGGYFLGIESVFYVIPSYQLASIVGYSLTKYMNSDFSKDVIRLFPKTEAYIHNINNRQIITTILSRLSPALPFAIMNVTLSIANISLRNFFIAGLFGMLPRTLFFIWLGSKAHYLESALNNSQGLVWSIGLTILLMYIMYKLLKPKTAQ